VLQNNGCREISNAIKSLDLLIHEACSAIHVDGSDLGRSSLLAWIEV
jgi:hypothetical protein